MHSDTPITKDASKSFEQVLMQHQSMLYRLCSRFSSREVTVEDLMQDIAVALWRQREKLWSVPDGVQRKSWIWKLARNTAIDTIRKAPSFSELDKQMADSIQDEDHSLVDTLREQIALLEEPDRTIVRLQLEGYAYAEIAAKLKMTEKNVSVRLVRVKEQLRQIMNRIAN